MKQIKGQILGEAIVAMGIITVGVLGVIGFLAHSIGEGRNIADQTIAANLAAEGIEITKNILDRNSLERFRLGDGMIAWNKDFNMPGFFEVDFRSETLGHQVSIVEDRNALTLLKKERIGDAQFYSYTGAEYTIFRRSVEIKRGINENHIRVISRVYWIARAGSSNQVTISSDFYNWR